MVSFNVLKLYFELVDRFENKDALKFFLNYPQYKITAQMNKFKSQYN